MRNFPFVLGTDIAKLSRFSPAARPWRFTSLARRILTQEEVDDVRDRRRITLSDATGGNSVETKLGARSLHQWLTNSGETHLSKEIPEKGPFSPEESAYLNSAFKAARWLGGRWTAKEAARKAWGAALIGWKDVRVVREQIEPQMNTATRPVRIICQPFHQEGDDYGETSAEWDLKQEGLLSISHDGDYAVATVMAEPLDEKLLAVFMNRAKILEERRAKEWQGSRQLRIAGRRKERAEWQREMSVEKESESKTQQREIVSDDTKDDDDKGASPLPTK